MYCVFNANLITSGGISHIRQMREDKAGNRYPLSVDKKAVIRKENGLFHGIINDNQVVAISDDIETVYKRLKRVDRDIDIDIRYKNRRYKTVESYYNSLLPRVYRITSSNAKKHGFIIAMNSIKNNEPSHVELFYSLEELYNRFDKLKNQNYYVHIAHLPDVDRTKLGGIEALDIPDDFKDISDLKTTIEARQRAGSHEAYIKQVEKSKRSVLLHNVYFYDGDREREEWNE